MRKSHEKDQNILFDDDCWCKQLASELTLLIGAVCRAFNLSFMQYELVTGLLIFI